MTCGKYNRDKKYRNFSYHYSSDEKKEPKQEFVSVPKEIQFVETKEGIGLIIEDHMLRMGNLEKWEFISSNFGWYKITDGFVLVPVKREELKAGDWAGWCLTMASFCPEKLNFYNLIIGTNYDRLVKVDIIDRHYMNVKEFDSAKEGNWFKVVPKNSVWDANEVCKKRNEVEKQ